MKTIALVLVLLTLPGCASMLLGTSAQKKAAQGVTEWCKQPAPYRLAFRSEFNTLIAPNSAQINCAADTTTPP